MSDSDLNKQFQIVGQMNRVIQKHLEGVESSIEFQKNQFEMLKGLYEKMSFLSERTQKLSDTIASIGSGPAIDPTSVADLTKSLSDGSDGFNRKGGVFSKIASGFKSIGFAAFAVIGMGLSSLFGLIKGVLKISKFSIQSIAEIGQQLFNLATITFEIINLLYEKLISLAQETFSGGGSEYAQAIHDLKKQYGDLNQSTPKSILQMSRNTSALSKAGLSAFRVFGNRAERIKEFLEEFAIKMGPLFDFYAREFAESDGALMAIVKGMGLSGEDMQMMASSAISRGAALADELIDTHNATRIATKALGSATKLINRDIAKAMRNVKAFGGSSKESIAKAAAYARSLGLNIDGLTGIADSFHTYDNAVETGEKLFEIFGVRIDTYAMLEEQDLGTMIQHLREGFVNAGVDTSALNKSYTSLLASTVGVDEDIARQLLSYKNVGGDLADINESEQKLSAGIRTMSGALKDLATSIEFKILSGGSLEGGFIEMFLQGLYRAAKMNGYIRPLLRNIFLSLNIFFQEGIRTFQAIEKYFPGVHEFIEGVRRFFNPTDFSRLITRINDSFINLFIGIKDDSYTFTDFYNDISDAFFDHLNKFNEIDNGNLSKSLWESVYTTSTVIGAVFSKIGELFASGIWWLVSLISGDTSASDYLMSVFQNLISEFDGTFSEISTTVSGTLSKISSSVSGLIDEAKKISVLDSINFDSQSLMENAFGIFNTVKNSVSEFYEDVKSIMIKIYDAIVKTILLLHIERKIFYIIAGIFLTMAVMAKGMEKVTGYFARKVAERGAAGLFSQIQKGSSRFLPLGEEISKRLGNSNYLKRMENVFSKRASLTPALRAFAKDFFGVPIEFLSNRAGLQQATHFVNQAVKELSPEQILRFGPTLKNALVEISASGIPGAQSRFIDDVLIARIDESILKAKNVIKGGSLIERFSTRALPVLKKFSSFFKSKTAVKEAAKAAQKGAVFGVKDIAKLGLGKRAALAMSRLGPAIALSLITAGAIELFVDDPVLKHYAHAGVNALLLGAGVYGSFLAFGPIGGITAGVIGGGAEIGYILGAEDLEEWTLISGEIAKGRARAAGTYTENEIETARENLDEIHEQIASSSSFMGEIILRMENPDLGATIERLDEAGNKHRQDMPRQMHFELLDIAHKKVDPEGYDLFYKKLATKRDALLAQYPGDKKDPEYQAFIFNKLNRYRRGFDRRDLKLYLPSEVFNPYFVETLLKPLSSLSGLPPAEAAQKKVKILNDFKSLAPKIFTIDSFKGYLAVAFNTPEDNLSPEAQAYFKNDLYPRIFSSLDSLVGNLHRVWEENSEVINHITEIAQDAADGVVERENAIKAEGWKKFLQEKKFFDDEVKNYNHYEKFIEMIGRSIEVLTSFIEEDKIKSISEVLKNLCNLIEKENINFSRFYENLEDLKLLLRMIDFNSFIKKINLKKEQRAQIKTTLGDMSTTFYLLLGRAFPLNEEEASFDTPLGSSLLQYVARVIDDTFTHKLIEDFSVTHTVIATINKFKLFLDKFAYKGEILVSTGQSLKPIVAFGNLKAPSVSFYEKSPSEFTPQSQPNIGRHFYYSAKEAISFDKSSGFFDKEEDSKFKYFFSNIPQLFPTEILTGLNLKFEKIILFLDEFVRNTNVKSSFSKISSIRTQQFIKPPPEPTDGNGVTGAAGSGYSSLDLSSAIGTIKPFTTYDYNTANDNVFDIYILVSLMKQTLSAAERAIQKLLPAFDLAKKAINSVKSFDVLSQFLTGVSQQQDEYKTFIGSILKNIETNTQNIDNFLDHVETKTAEALDTIFRMNVDIHAEISANNDLLAREKESPFNIKFTPNVYLLRKGFQSETKTFTHENVTYTCNYKVNYFGGIQSFEREVFLRPASVVLDRLNAVSIAPEKPFGPSSYVMGDNSLETSQASSEENRWDTDPDAQPDSSKVFDGIDWTIYPNQAYYIIGAAKTATAAMAASAPNGSSK